MATANTYGPPIIDFSQIGRLADTYYNAQEGALKRQAFRDDRAFQQAERDRQAQLRNALSGGIPMGSDGTPDYGAMAQRFAQLGGLDEATKFLGAADQSRERADNRAHRDRSFEADQAYRNQQLGIQREQLTPSGVREYKFYADQERATGRQPLSYDEWSRRPSAGSGKYGTTVQYTTDGRPWVTGSDGTVKFLDLGGAAPLGPEGTAAARARGSATGKTMGQARSDLPGVIQNSTQMLGMLNSLENDPYLDRMLGPIDSRTPDISSDAGRVASKIDQINGAAFLQAFESLKGGGQITEIEGLKATQAISRLTNRNMSPEDYKAAINELKQIIANGVIRARVDAGELPQEALGQLRNFEGTVSAPSGAPARGPQAPAPGTVMDGYRFRGGNPADPNSWERL